MRLITITLFFLTGIQPALSQTDITIDELKDHITYLASDDLKGRKPGTEGGKLAAEYIRKQLRELNLELLADDGFQYFDVIVDASASEDNKLSFGGTSAVLGEDFMPVSFSPDTVVIAPVVFAGYGFDIETDSIRWNDYDSIDVAGKFVIILRGGPDKDDSSYDPHLSLRKKMLVANDHNAAGVLFVSGRMFDEQDALMEVSIDQARIPAGIQALHIKRSLADKLLSETDQTIDKLEERLIAEKSPHSLVIPTEVNAKTKIDKKHVMTQNVIALLKSENHLDHDEYVIVGGHYDHLGMGGPGSGSRRPDTTAIHNGADDNASGTASIIEIMEKLAADRNKLNNSVLFIAFGAEEMGLLGSRHYAENPVLDLNNARIMINLDMIGNLDLSTEALTIGGTGTGVGLSDIVNKLAEKHGITLKESKEGHGPSDHSSFYAKDVPVLFFFSGTTDIYHTPEDDVEHIEWQGLKAIADLAYDIAFDMTNSSEPLVFQEAGPKAPRDGERYRFKVTLGIMPDIAAADIDGLRAELVIKGRPAHGAGMEKGDIIVALDGKPVHNIYDYMNRLQDFKKGQRISVDVMRDGEKKVLIVEL